MATTISLCGVMNGMVVVERFKPHAVLEGPQREASDPDAHVWLSASAGTGKTYVLSARVLRLLVRGVRPDAILCLTFTKSGAAEMAERVHARLAQWVRLDRVSLHLELEALGEDAGPAAVDHARTLFAKVLDAPGGGLRIMTIHAFCQTLLAGFPLEAGLMPGFRPLEGREQAALVDRVLSDLVIDAEREGDVRLTADLRALSLRLGETAAVRFLQSAASALDALDALGAGIEATVRRALGIPADFCTADVVAACADRAFDREALLELARIYGEWNTVTGRKAADQIAEWLLGSPEARAGELSRLSAVWNTKEGGRRKQAPRDPRFASLVAEIDAWCGGLINQIDRHALATMIASALNVARRYARAYADAKRVRGLVDFDDMIRLTRGLLDEDGMGAWIRYKLDQSTDHVLVDESQDTNADQWAIVRKLTEEFWAGAGVKDGAARTIFTVGDYKQAIFGFQGTDPQFYEAARHLFARDARDSAQAMVELSLQQSFRSSPPVLDVVDAVLGEIGEDMGAPETPQRHVSARGGAGDVLLLPPVFAESDDDGDGEEGWMSSATRNLAAQLAMQIKRWLASGLPHARDNRLLTPGDVMILVRKRSDLASLLVARLQEEDIPVAGVDRLQLGAPVAVQDLVAAIRFAVQPHDDLNLAALLVSPLIGWDDDALFSVAHERTGSLWSALPPGETRNVLLSVLANADTISPYRFLETLLSGPVQARRKLLRRLGNEARDPIDELLNAALQFEREGVATLQPFLDAFDRNEADIVRDPGASGDAVRVMTVHGAKGLQAPLVILADACVDPERSLERGFRWSIDDGSPGVPLFRLNKEERALDPSIDAAIEIAERRARQEHWRLLYVAMTRAEDRLVVAGSLGPAAAGRVPVESWYAAVERGMLACGAVNENDPHWGVVRRFGRIDPRRVPPPRADSGVPKRALDERPGWIDRAAPQESRPPRPLAPSSLGEDATADSPPGRSETAPAARGRLMHALFERLPALPPAQRRDAALAWVRASGGDPAIVDEALRVIEYPDYAALFRADGLAEAPVAGVVDGVVVSGTIDRLVVGDGIVEIVDFKTGIRVPASLDEIPVAHLRQMAAYAALLGQAFPGHDVRASLLYSQGPMLHRLPPMLLDVHKPALATAKDNFTRNG